MEKFSFRLQKMNKIANEHFMYNRIIRLEYWISFILKKKTKRDMF